jgi:hypothetical protein
MTSRFQWELAACRGRRRFTSPGPRLCSGAVWPASPRCLPAWWPKSGKLFRPPLPRFESGAVRWDGRHPFTIGRGEIGIQVRVNGRWWMPPRPFPPGFDQAQAEFDTVANAVKALRLTFGSEQFVRLDDDGDVLEVETPQAFIRHVNEVLGTHQGRNTRC